MKNLALKFVFLNILLTISSPTYAATIVYDDTVTLKDTDQNMPLSIGELRRRANDDGDLFISIRTLDDFLGKWDPSGNSPFDHAGSRNFSVRYQSNITASPLGASNEIITTGLFSEIYTAPMAGGVQSLPNPANDPNGRSPNTWEVRGKDRKVLPASKGVRKVTWKAQVNTETRGLLELRDNDNPARALLGWDANSRLETSLPKVARISNNGNSELQRQQGTQTQISGSLSLTGSSSPEGGVTFSGQKTVISPPSPLASLLNTGLLEINLFEQKVRDCAKEEFIQVNTDADFQWNFENVRSASVSTVVNVEQLEVTGTKCTVANGKSKSTFGQSQNTEISFDGDNQTLSFSNSLIDTLNLDGSDSGVNLRFTEDPILGATISVSDFKLVESFGNGFVFEGGELEVSDGNTLFLSADIPLLLVDDSMKRQFGNNIIGTLDNISINLSSESDFLSIFNDDIFSSSTVATEFFGLTDIDITPLIADGTSFTTFASIHGSHSSVPEPTSTLGLLALGTLGAGSALLRKKKHSTSARK